MSNDSLIVAGLWTPIDASGAGLAFTVQAADCFYRMFGDIVIVFFDFAYPANADATPTLIGGLPLTSRNTTNGVGAGSFGQNGAGVALNIIINPNTTQFLLRNAVTNAAITNINMSTVTVRGTMVYPLP